MNEISEEGASVAENVEVVQEFPIKRGPGRPRKYPLPQSTATAAALAMPSASMGSNSSSGTTPFSMDMYQVQKLLMKQKMKKYAKQYIAKERLKEQQYQARHPSVSHQSQAEEVVDTDDEKEGDDDEGEDDEDRQVTRHDAYHRWSQPSYKKAVPLAPQRAAGRSKIEQILGYRT